MHPDSHDSCVAWLAPQKVLQRLSTGSANTDVPLVVASYITPATDTEANILSAILGELFTMIN